MTDIITTKNLTKNELSGAKLLAAFVILGGLALFLNSAQMDQKEIPEISFTASPSQATDGSGLVSFGAAISKFSAYDLKLKLEYSLDGENYSALNPSQAIIDSGSIDFNPASEFQVSNIVTQSENVNLSFIWDTKSDPQLNQISNPKTNIKIILFYKLKDTVPSVLTNVNAEENPPVNSDVAINSSEATITDGVIIETNEPTSAGSENVSQLENTNSEQPILPESPDLLNTVVAAVVNAVEAEINSAPSVADTNSTEGIWLEMPVISENFKIDIQSPKILSGILDVKSRKLHIAFSEAMDTAQTPDLTKIVLQNSDGSVNYNIIKGNYAWSADDTLSMDISLSNIDIAFLTIDEAFQSILAGTKFQAESGNNMKDLFGNEVFDVNFISLPIDNQTPPENKEDKKNDEIKKDETIFPENNKIITTRGYNKNCSFDPDDFVMTAGETREISLNLLPRDADSKYIIASTSVPSGFDVKILQASGSASGPVTVSVTAPADAASRLYKILFRYEDFTPQSVSYVNNCVLGLTVQ